MSRKAKILDVKVASATPENNRKLLSIIAGIAFLSLLIFALVSGGAFSKAEPYNAMSTLPGGDLLEQLLSDESSVVTDDLLEQLPEGESAASLISRMRSIILEQEKELETLRSSGTYEIDYENLKLTLPVDHSFKYDELGGGKRSLQIVAPNGKSMVNIKG